MLSSGLFPGVCSLNTDVSDKKKWKDFVQQAKPHSGL
jgi:hypothetical protein